MHGDPSSTLTFRPQQRRSWPARTQSLAKSGRGQLHAQFGGTGPHLQRTHRRRVLGYHPQPRPASSEQSTSIRRQSRTSQPADRPQSRCPSSPFLLHEVQTRVRGNQEFSGLHATPPPQAPVRDTPSRVGVHGHSTDRQRIGHRDPRRTPLYLEQLPRVRRNGRPERYHRPARRSNRRSTSPQPDDCSDRQAVRRPGRAQQPRHASSPRPAGRMPGRQAPPPDRTEGLAA